MTEELLSVDGVAERLKVNQQTVRNWIARGELAETRLGARRVRVADSDLNRFLKLKEQAKTEATARPAPSRRRRASASDMQAVETLIESMLTTAADLPLGSPIARELAESAGRLQVALRAPRGGDSQRLRSSVDSSLAKDSGDG